jgi:hypothetical protein
MSTPTVYTRLNGVFVREIESREFNRWRTIGALFKIGRVIHVVAECKCGSIRHHAYSNLSTGKSRSCGCYVKEMENHPLKTHGEGGKTAEYEAWQGILSRCYNKNKKHYPRYGGRGIRVCDQWINSYEHFLADVGRRPSSMHSLDRFPDNDGNYEPGNVRWATDKQQANNKSNNRILEIYGKKMTMSEWSDISGIHVSVILRRLTKGWSRKSAVFTPIAETQHRMLTVEGVSKSVTDWSKETGLTVGAIRNRIDRGWSPINVVTIGKNKENPDKPKPRSNGRFCRRQYDAAS